MDRKARLRTLLRQNLQFITSQTVYPFGGQSLPPTVPFDLTAADYLAFAEQELDRGTLVSRINCVSHLKRATDCQLDAYLYVFGLYNLFRDRNLGFPSKMKFLHRVGLFSPRSLTRLNLIRNKVEHEYQVPNIDDLEVYFDLVAAFVQLLEGATTQPDGVMFDGFDDESEATIRMQYLRKTPVIVVAVQRHRGKADKETDIELYAMAQDDIDTFAFFFKVLNILVRFRTSELKDNLAAMLNGDNTQV